PRHPDGRPGGHRQACAPRAAPGDAQAALRAPAARRAGPPRDPPRARAERVDPPGDGQGWEARDPPAPQLGPRAELAPGSEPGRVWHVRGPRDRRAAARKARAAKRSRSATRGRTRSSRRLRRPRQGVGGDYWGVTLASGSGTRRSLGPAANTRTSCAYSAGAVWWMKCPTPGTVRYV